ncbi:MAG: hypothetical protein HY689_13380 [Chloroflexi bacterium]|nr:hypothetical protein [Chloroflexota bacterium]
MHGQKGTATTRAITQQATTGLGKALIGGALGTIAFSAALRGARAVGLPRLYASRLLGSEVLPVDRGGNAVGMVWHLFNGSVVFPLLHAGLFKITGLTPSVTSGLITGIIHGVITGVGMGALRPVDGIIREPKPGFFGINRGATAPTLWVLSNIVYGAILGGSYGMAAAAVRRPRIIERVEEERRAA